MLIVQINRKAAEALADPQEYHNLFEDWQIALAIESKVAQERYLLFSIFPAWYISFWV